MEREKGQDVQTMTCPNCGNEVEMVAMPDGGVAQGPCPNCYGGSAPEERATAAEEPRNLKREKTTAVQEAAPTQEETQ